MNAASSRSHAVLTLTLSLRHADDAEGLTARTAKLHLVDLAGEGEARVFLHIVDRERNWGRSGA
jgi:hypothetical protein